MCLSSAFRMSSSLAQLTAPFSVLLAAITHFTLAFFQRNKHSQGVTFAGQFLVWLGKFPLGSKLISGGVAIRMSWCAFFEKINSRGGRLFRTGEYVRNKDIRKTRLRTAKSKKRVRNTDRLSFNRKLKNMFFREMFH